MPLMRGATIAEVGDSLDGDLLGEDPVATAVRLADEAVAVVAERLPAGEKVHLSYGDEDPAEYVRQLAADHLVHAWDLAAATGQDRSLDAELVAEVAAWFAEREELYRGAGAVGARVETVRRRPPGPAAGGGRTGRRMDTAAALSAFSAAFGSGDVDAIMALMTEDCVFESTGPAPDGVRRAGADDVRAGVGGAVRRDPGRVVRRGGVVRRRRPRRAALAVRVDQRATARPGTCAGSTC